MDKKFWFLQSGSLTSFSSGDSEGTACPREFKRRLTLDQIGSLFFNRVDGDDSMEGGDHVRRFELELVLFDELEYTCGAGPRLYHVVVSLVAIELAGVQSFFV
jgi:hypothetical protein